MAQDLISTAEAVKRMLGNVDYPYAIMERPYGGLSEAETAAQARKLAQAVEGLLTA